VGFYQFVTSRIENNNDLYGFAFQEEGDLESRKVSLRIVFFYIILITGAKIENEKAFNFLLLPRGFKFVNYFMCEKLLKLVKAF
jgi:hypothetical protein